MVQHIIQSDDAQLRWSYSVLQEIFWQKEENFIEIEPKNKYIYSNFQILLLYYINNFFDWNVNQFTDNK